VNRLAKDITDLLDQRYPMQLTCREIADTLQNGATPRQIYNCIYNMPQKLGINLMSLLAKGHSYQIDIVFTTESNH
jgi:hypothetical protein